MENRFNPTMVRLLQWKNKGLKEGCASFNPTMVRLLPHSVAEPYKT